MPKNELLLPDSSGTLPALPTTEISDQDWDDTADVVIVGFGAAGACAALEAKKQGAQRVIVIDRFFGGGATNMSGGVFYAGGGTSIQRDANVTDDVDNMFRYLSLEVQDVVSPSTLRDFCEQSAANLDWLRSHGVPFEGSLCPVKTSYPTDDYYLYYSGNEGVSPYREAAIPAARGHRAVGSAMPGANFYQPLRSASINAGAIVKTQTRVTRLLQDAQQRVIGLEAHQIKAGWWRFLHGLYHRCDLAVLKFMPPLALKFRKRCLQIEEQHSESLRIRARNGVILSAGGFIYNRQMVEQYAPNYSRAMPLGTPADNGSGIRLGQSVGGATDRMSRISAWRFINPPEAFAKGMIVNSDGKRYVNEFKYGAAIGEAMVEHNNGIAWLIIDHELRELAKQQARPGRAQWFQWGPAWINLLFNCRKAESLEQLATMLKMAPASLQQTLEAYNDSATGNTPDPFGKDSEKMHEMRRGPYYAINCSLNSRKFACATLTLGGLVVDEASGQVRHRDGQLIQGLYAAGRTAVGVCSRQYVSGLSIADCVYSGRRAGKSASLVRASDPQ